MNTRFGILVSAAIAISGSSAFAADVDWSGPYVGLGLFGGNATFETPSTGDFDFDLDNVLAFHAGYLHALGAVVVGAEYEVGNTGYSFGSGPDDVADLNYQRVKVSAGYAVGQVLPYAFTGVGKVSGLETDFAPERSDSSAFLGLGTAFQVNGNFRLSAEYSRQNIKDYDETGNDLITDAMSLRASLSF
jgi:hypothetical protein